MDVKVSGLANKQAYVVAHHILHAKRRAEECG